MSDVIWKDRLPGEAGRFRVDDVSDQLGEGALLMHDGKPDWVRHPITQQQLRCLSQGRGAMTCPLCKKPVTGVVTEAEGGIANLDCPSCKQYVWFTKRVPNGT